MIARSTFRPMRPKPLIATFTVILGNPPDHEVEMGADLNGLPPDLFSVSQQFRGSLT
jgi:hypothetical protein